MASIDRLAVDRQALIGVPALDLRSLHAIEGAAVLLPGIHPVAVRVPEIRAEFGAARIQQADIVEHLVIEILLRMNAQDRGLDAQIDVLRHQRDRDVLAFRLQGERRTEDAVVFLAAGHAGGQFGSEDARLYVQRPGRMAVGHGGTVGQRQAGLDVAVGGAAGEFVQEAVGLAHVTRDLGGTDLGIVQFLQHRHRQEDVVLVKTEQRGGVVHQDVGIQHEQPFAGDGLLAQVDLTS
jgi:hypothetical protein